MHKGIIISNISNTYIVEVNDEEYVCYARGKFKNQTITPLVGDNVEIDILDENTNILEEHLQIGNFGGFPSITIPNGFIDNLPVGINITGNCFDDENILNIAYTKKKMMPYKGQIAKEK